MKKISCFLLIYLFANLSCIGQATVSSKEIDAKLKSLGLPKDFSKEWKTDSTGCLHLRGQYGHDLDKNLSLIGISYADFLEIFGEPNEKTDSTHFNYYTYADCDEKGLITLKPENFAFVTFYFENGKLKAIGYSVA